jgi:hypothetical protein
MKNKLRNFVIYPLHKLAESCEHKHNIYGTEGNLPMKKPESLARRLSHASGDDRAGKPVEITDIVEGAQCTAAYIAQMTGELANLANGARFQSLAHLLARAQLEAELWSRQGT